MKSRITIAVALGVLGLGVSLTLLPGCAQPGQTGEGGRHAEGVSDLLGVAADVASGLGEEKTAKRIKLARKPFAAEALKNPETREAKALAIGQTLGLQALANIGPAVRDNGLQRYVNLVCMAVSKQSPRYNQSFYCAVLWNDTPTGVSLPGGYIFLSTGLIEALEDEGELAAVLAHEVAHVVHEDGLNMYERQLKAGFIPEVVAETGDKGEQLVKGYRGLWDEVLVNGYSRRQETDADRASVAWVADAGYEPRGLIAFLRRAEARPGLNHESGKMHPSPADRIRGLEAEVAKLGSVAGRPKLADRYRKMALEPVRRLKPEWESKIKPAWEAQKAK